MPVTPIPLSRFRPELLSLYDPPCRVQATRGKMRQVLDLVAELGIAATDGLTPPAVARFIRLRPDWRPATVKGLLGYLRAACRYAVTMGYLAVDPFTVRRDWLRSLPPAADFAGPRHHPAADIARVLGHLRSRSATWEGGRLFALASTIAFTGLRRMEALRLRAIDVDAPAGLLRPGNGHRLKTRGSHQPVPIPGELAPILAEWLPRAGSEWAFPGVTRKGPWTGGPIGKRPLDCLKSAALRCGVTGFTFQSLRHSWATHAESRWNLGEACIQRVLRHTTPMTQRHYRHADADNLRAAVADISFQ
jgi:integrase